MGELGRVYIDYTVVDVQHAMSAVWHEADSLRVRLTDELLRSAGMPSPGTVFRGEEAAQLLTTLLDAAQHLADLVLNAFPPAQWLWYLRRLDGIFRFNDTPTTEPYCQALAEALARLSPRKAPEPSSGGLRYPCRTKDMRRVLKLRTIVGLMYVLHSSLRWAGKGSPISVSVDLVDPVPPTELAEAVRLYDDRSAAAGMGPLAPLGLGEPVGLTPNIDPDTRTNLPFMVPLPERQEIPLFPTNSLNVGAAVGRYLEGLFDLRKIGPLADESLPPSLRWPSPAVEAATLLYCCYHPWFLEIGHVNAFVQGYCVLPRQDAIALLDWSLEGLRTQRFGGLLPAEVIPSHAEDVLHSLSTLPNSTWPPRPVSPVLQAGGRLVMIDLLAATDLFFRALARTGAGGGPEANVWAREFEHHVQRRISGTPWAPSDALASLRGRTLRLEGNEITDVDAVGARGRTLLLVQCKGAPFTAAYDRGDYAAVRNRASDALAASDGWSQRIEQIRSNPVGDNYDFSAFDVFGLVVYPFVVFVTGGAATDEVLPGLRAVVSVEEVVQWCLSS